MILLDIILLAIIAGFAIYGFASGFVHAVSSLIGMVFSIIVAVNIYMTVTFWVLPDVMASQYWAQVIVFFVILTAVSKIVQILVKVIGKAFDVVSIIPFTKTLNRVLGVVVGLIEGALISASLIFVLMSLPNLPEAIQVALDDSLLASALTFISGILVFLFPGAIERGRELVTDVGGV